MAKEKYSNGKVVSIRLTGYEVQLLDRIPLSISQFIHFCIRDYIEQHNLYSPEEMEILYSIQKTMEKQLEYKLKYETESAKLKKLQNQYDDIIERNKLNNAYKVMKKLNEDYSKQVHNATVDNVVDYLKQNLKFFDELRKMFNLTYEEMENILTEFLNQKVMDINDHITFKDIIEDNALINFVD